MITVQILGVVNTIADIPFRVPDPRSPTITAEDCKMASASVSSAVAAKGQNRYKWNSNRLQHIELPKFEQ